MLTIEDVARQLNVSVATIRRMIEAGELKASKVRGTWRIKQEDVDRYLEEQSNKR